MLRVFRLYIIVYVLFFGMFVNIKTLLADGLQNEDLAEEILSKIKDSYDSGNWDILFKDSKSLLSVANENDLPFYTGKSNGFLGIYYFMKNETDSSVYYYKKAIEAYSVCKDTLNQGIVFSRIGLDYKKIGDNENALLYFNNGVDLLESVKDIVWSSFANNQMGMIYFYQGNYFMALKHLQKSKDASIKSENLLNLGKIGNTMGIVYRKTNDKKKEEESYLEAISILEKLDTCTTLGMAYNNLSEIYFDKGEVDKGFETLEKAKKIYKSSNYPLGLCSYYAVLSYYHLETLNPPNYDKVIEYSLKSMEIAKEFEDSRQYADATSFLGTAYFKTNQLGKAKKVLEEGLEIAKQNDFKHEVVKITEVLANVYEKDDQLNKAIFNLREYIAIKDSIVGEEKIKEFTQLDMEFKFREQQISDSLKQKNRILVREFLFEKEIQSQKQTVLILVFVSLLVIVIAFFLFIDARRNKKQVKSLSEKSAQINQQNIEIENYAEQIQEAYMKLHELDEYKQAMTYMLVHDLKNPLNLLVNSEVFDDEQEMRLIVNRTSKQMLNMITNLLDISKAEHNKMQLNKSKVQLFDILASAISDVDFLCIQKNIKIINKSAKDFSLQADKEILLRIFINILTNAIKFSPTDGSIILDAVITEKKHLRISFKDSGPGIAKKFHEVIFEKFKQIKETKSGEVSSTGLGLAFCKMAVESHNWSIGVDSEPKKGAEFWINIEEYQSIEKA